MVRRKARAWLGLVEHDNDAAIDKGGYASEDVSEVQNDDETPSGQPALGNGIQIAIVRPRNFRDAATVGEYYRQGIPVIINLEDVDHALATRIVDFVSGLVLGLGGDMERPSRRAFLIVPGGAAILTAHDGLTDKGFFNQALRPVNDSPISPASWTTMGTGISTAGNTCVIHHRGSAWCSRGGGWRRGERPRGHLAGRLRVRRAGDGAAGSGTRRGLGAGGGRGRAGADRGVRQ